MESFADDPPIIVILGQTASGKSALALELAKRFNGEIIAADSRTIYKGMDIGTAKPSAEERRAVRHYLIDILEPNEQFSAAEFQRLANEAIHEIAGRGKLPIVVGGTGLYIDALLYDFSFRDQADASTRKAFAELTVDELQAAHRALVIPLPENERNPRHLTRSLEAGGRVGSHKGLRPNTLIIGLQVERDVLVPRIQKRVDGMVDAGFVQELNGLVKRYGWDAPGLQAPGYKAFRLYLAGQATLEEAKRQFVQNDTQYAKRQKTWFKRNKSISWISKSEDAVDLVTTFLNK